MLFSHTIMFFSHTIMLFSHTIIVFFSHNYCFFSYSYAFSHTIMLCSHTINVFFSYNYCFFHTIGIFFIQLLFFLTIIAFFLTQFYFFIQLMFFPYNYFFFHTIFVFSHNYCFFSHTVLFFHTIMFFFTIFLLFFWFFCDVFIWFFKWSLEMKFLLESLLFKVIDRLWSVKEPQAWPGRSRWGKIATSRRTTLNGGWRPGLVWWSVWPSSWSQSAWPKHTAAARFRRQPLRINQPTRNQMSELPFSFLFVVSHAPCKDPPFFYWIFFSNLKLHQCFSFFVPFIHVWSQKERSRVLFFVFFDQLNQNGHARGVSKSEKSSHFFIPVGKFCRNE